MRYRVIRRIAWCSPNEERKRVAGKPYKKKTAKVGKTLTEETLDGADVEWLLKKGAIEPTEDGET